MKRLSVLLGLALLLGLTLATPALAGGWAVITLDALPAELVAGRELEIGFVVRQHGVTPATGLTPIIRAQLDGSDTPLTFTAEEKGDAGHYVATLLFPQQGEWQWSIDAYSANQPMPMLTVAAAPVVTAAPLPRVARPWLPWAAGIAGAAGILIGSVIVLRRKARWALALILAGVLVSGGSIVSAAAQAAAETTPSVPTEAEAVVPASSQVDLGRNLFIAKGCMMCHSHNETNRIREFGVNSGPDLSHFKSSPEYLRLWLNDPSSVKPATRMPTLGLSTLEIEALIAFINND